MRAPGAGPLGCGLIASLLALSSTIGRSRAEAELANEPLRLASIWGEPLEAAKDSAAGAFRLVSELHAPELGTYLLEESALQAEQAFRMDLLRLDGRRLQARSSLLSLAKSAASWLFRPFKCELFVATQLADVLGAGLAEKFPSNEARSSESFVLAGLSSIWLWAARNSARQQWARASIQQQQQQQQPAGARMLLNAYDRITVTGDAQFAYDAVFYFESRLDSECRPESLVALHLVERGAQPGRVVLRARIVDFETQNAPKLKRQGDLFELPVGFGCAQAHSRQAGLEAADPALGACLSAKLAAPRQCQLEVSSLSPRSGEALRSDVAKWRSQQSSFTFTAGLVQAAKGEQQAELAIAQLTTRSELSPTGADQIRRIKRVWPSVPPSAPANSSKSLYLELDERAPSGRKKCLAAQHASMATKPAFEFEFFEPQAGSARRVLAGLALDDAQFQTLFANSSAFQQIRDTTDARLASREVTQERRLGSFDLFDQTGRRVWSGPASIVRRFVLLADTPANAATRALLPFDERQLRTSILLLSADQSQLLARVHLTLSPGRPVDRAQLHRALDVGACLSELLEDPSRRANLLKVAEHDRISFNINFPAQFSSSKIDQKYSAQQQQQQQQDDPDHAQDEHETEDTEMEQILQQDLGLRQQIYDKFLTNLQALAQLAGSKLDALQVGDIEIDTGKQLVNVAATLHKWPQVLGFVERLGSRINAPGGSLSILSELKASVESCAESCDHYNCLAFQFCHTEEAKSCDLLLGEKARSDEQIIRALSFVDELKCNFYSRPQNFTHDQAPISPLRFLSLLNEAVSRQSDESDALEIRLQHADTEIILRPSSLQTDFKLPDSSPRGQDASFITDQVGEIQQESLIEPEYEIIFEGRKFVEQTKLSENFPIQEASQVLSIDECRRFCDENDCRSFSYCKDAKVCMLSQLHETNRIESESSERSFCRILSRDYLSKFHELASKLSIEPEKIGQWKPIESDTAVSFHRDCAIKCMNSEKCRSFLYCQSKDQTGSSSCSLFDHRNSLNLVPGAIFSAPPKNDTPLSPTNECSYFRRSYLVEFHKYHSKRLPLEPETQVTLLTQGFDAENCATQCVDSNDSGLSCSAFHVCLDTGSSKIPKLTCAISSSSQIRSNDLLDAQKCTAFLPVEPAKLVTQKDERSEPEDSNSGFKNANSSSWLFTSFTLLAGAIVGYSVAWSLTKAGYLPKASTVNY